MPVNERTILLLTSRLLKEVYNSLRWSRGQQDVADTAFFAQNYPSRDNPSVSNNSRINQGRQGTSDQGVAAHRNNSTKHRSNVSCCNCYKDRHTHEECHRRMRDELLAKSRDDDAVTGVSPPIQTLSLKAARSNGGTSRSNQDHSYISNFTCFTPRRSQEWFADSGSTQHMTNQRKFFKVFSSVEAKTWFVKGIGGAQLAIHCYGSIEFTALVDGLKRATLIETVLYVPDLVFNLLSIAAITEVGVTVHFLYSRVSFNKDDSIVMVGERIGRMFTLLAITVDPRITGRSSQHQPLHL